jgi:hypothetical protein
MINRYRYSGGFTYFVRGVGGGPIKIGQTAADPLRRVRELQVGSPVVLRLLVVLLGHRHEAAFHSRFAAERLHGEWFAPTPELRKAMVSVARMQRGSFAMRTFKHPRFWSEVERREAMHLETDPDVSVDVLWPETKRVLWDAAVALDAMDEYPLALDLLGRAA